MSQIAAAIGQEFAFASGRTGVLKQLLLTASDRDRMLGSQSLKETEAILTEIKFTNAIDQGLKKTDDILRAVGAWVRSEVEGMTPEHKLDAFSILWIQEDAPLIAYLLKKRNGHTSDVSSTPSPAMSTFAPSELEALILEGQEGSLPRSLVLFVQSVPDDADPITIDTEVATFVANQSLRAARSSGSRLLKKYVQHTIDINNIRTALRGGAEHCTSGGTIPAAKLAGGKDAILRAIDLSDLYGLSGALRDAKDVNDIELALSEVIAEDIATMWNIPMSIEPVFAFAALAQMHLRLIRVLAIGKRAGLSPQEIKRILPPFVPASHYVLS